MAVLPLRAGLCCAVEGWCTVFTMPSHRPRTRVTQADRAAGQAAEAAFAGWLDTHGVPYLYAEQSRTTFAEGLRGTAKRPDFLIGLPYLRTLAIDVKTKTSYDRHLIFDVLEVEKLTAFCQLFNATGLFACLAPSGSPLMKWLPLSAFPGLPRTTVNGTPVYTVKLSEALTIDARQDFSAALAKVCFR